MSQLYFTETGRVVAGQNEELTVTRRARKLLHLPPTAAPATLYLLARPHVGSTAPLHGAVNGQALPPLPPAKFDRLSWHTLTLPLGSLRAGENSIEFWTEAPAMTAWSLALENGHAHPTSAVSDDGGHTWRSQQMGYLNNNRGEYVVRVRLAEGAAAAPPTLVLEQPTQPRLSGLLRRLPPPVVAPQPALAQVRALSAWLSQQWPHTPPGRATVYAPWDAETILAWGGRARGHDERQPIVMCVHYAVAFVTACQALGLPARCVVFTGDLDSGNGHFAAEVWLAEFQTWALVDPNTDLMFFSGARPLSVPEVQAAGALGALAQPGPGTAYQRQAAHVASFIDDSLLTGACLRYRALWPRSDFLSHPELTPPGHGVTAYCETDLVWSAAALAQGFGMFPSFAEAAYFAAPPGLP